jgi:uncharacterized membrane protein
MTDKTDDLAPVDEAEFISAERVIFFSDAVVAIAITLLALGLPDVVGSSNTEVLRSLRHNTTAYLPFLISFVVIARYWRAHHRLYQYVARLDSRLITINVIWLLMIISTPYVTRVLSGGGAFSALRFGLYACVQVITIGTLVVMRWHIGAAGLLRAGAPASATGTDDISLLAIAATFAVSIPVAFATESEWTYVVWVAAAGVARAARRARGALAGG